MSTITPGLCIAVDFAWTTIYTDEAGLPAYIVGSTQVTVNAGDGPLFGDPTPEHPIRISLIGVDAVDEHGQVIDYTRMARFLATGRVADTLTGLTLVGGIDQDFAIGDFCSATIEADAINDLNNAIEGLRQEITTINQDMAPLAQPAFTGPATIKSQDGLRTGVWAADTIGTVTNDPMHFRVNDLDVALLNADGTFVATGNMISKDFVQANTGGAYPATFGNGIGNANYPGIWFNEPRTSSNYAVMGDNGSGATLINSMTMVDLRIANASKLKIDTTGFGFYGAPTVPQQAGDVATGLVALGLFSSATIAQGSIVGLDQTFVHKVGNVAESIDGLKTFTDDLFTSGGAIRTITPSNGSSPGNIYIATNHYLSLGSGGDVGGYFVGAAGAHTRLQIPSDPGTHRGIEIGYSTTDTFTGAFTRTVFIDGYTGAATFNGSVSAKATDATTPIFTGFSSTGGAAKVRFNPTGALEMYIGSDDSSALPGATSRIGTNASLNLTLASPASIELNPTDLRVICRTDTFDFYSRVSVIMSATSAQATSITQTNYAGGGAFTSIIKAGAAQGTIPLSRFQGISSTSTTYNLAAINATWVDNTDGSRKGRLSFYASDYTGVDKEGVRIESDGTQAITSTGRINVSANGGSQLKISDTSGLGVSVLELAGVASGWSLRCQGNSGDDFWLFNQTSGTIPIIAHGDGKVELRKSVSIGPSVIANAAMAITATGDGGGTTSAIGIYNAPLLKPAADVGCYSMFVSGTVDTTSGGNNVHYGIRIDPAGKTGAGTVGTAYGLYVAAPTIGTTNVTAYFGGPVTIAGAATFTGDVNAVNVTASGTINAGTRFTGPQLRLATAQTNVSALEFYDPSYAIGMDSNALVFSYGSVGAFKIKTGGVVNGTIRAQFDSNYNFGIGLDTAGTAGTLHAKSTAITTPTLVIDTIAGQTADLAWFRNGGALVASIGPTGAATFNGGITADSLTTSTTVRTSTLNSVYHAVLGNGTGDANYPGLWFDMNPTGSNYTIMGNQGNLQTFVNGNTLVDIRINNIAKLRVSPTGLAALGPLSFIASSSTTADQTQASITPSWADNTHATRKGRLSLKVSDATGTDKEGLRIDTEGTGTEAYLTLGIVNSPITIRDPANTNYRGTLTVNTANTILRGISTGLYLASGSSWYSTSYGGYVPGAFTFALDNPQDSNAGNGPCQLVAFNGGWAPTVGAFPYDAIQINATVNQTGTASGSYTGINVNVTETAALGSANRLMNLRVNGVSKFAVASNGDVTNAGSVTAAGNVVANNVGTTKMTLGTIPIASGFAGMWVEATPSITNYAFLGQPGQTLFNVASGGFLGFMVNNAFCMKIDATTTAITGDLTATGNLTAAGKLGVGNPAFTPIRIIHAKGAGNQYIRLEGSGPASDVTLEYSDGTNQVYVGILGSIVGTGSWGVYLNSILLLACLPSGNTGFGTKAPIQRIGVVGAVGFQAPSSTTPDQAQGRITPSWVDTTHASRKGRVSIYASDSSGTDKEGIAVQSDGTNVFVGLGGITVQGEGIPSKVTVFGADDPNIDVALWRRNIIASQKVGAYQFRTGSGGGFLVAEITSETGPAFIDSGDLVFKTRPSGGVSTERMRINSTGPITVVSTMGFGTPAPRCPLEVVSGPANVSADNPGHLTVVGPNYPIGTGNQPGNLNIASNDDAAMDMGGSLVFGGRYTTGSSNQANWATIKSGKADGVNTNYGGYLAFGTRTQGTGIAEQMRIDTLGNTGFGTTVPYTKAHVNGALTVTDGNPGSPGAAGRALVMGQAGQAAGNYSNLIRYYTSTTQTNNAIVFSVCDGSATGHVDTLTLNGDGTARLAGQIGFRAPSSTTPDQPQSRIVPSWADNTHGTRKGRLSLMVSDFNGDKEGLRIDTDGTTPITRNLGRLIVGGTTDQNATILATDPTTPSIVLYNTTLGQLMLWQWTAGTVQFGGQEVPILHRYSRHQFTNGATSVNYLNMDGTMADFSVPPLLPVMAEAAIPNRGIAWSSDNPGVLKARDPSGVLKTVNLT